jgi:hypothetical protein
MPGAVIDDKAGDKGITDALLPVLGGLTPGSQTGKLPIGISKLLFPQVDGRAALAKGFSGSLTAILIEEFNDLDPGFNLLSPGGDNMSENPICF